MGDVTSAVVRNLNSNPKDWRPLMRPDVLLYLSADFQENVLNIDHCGQSVYDLSGIVLKYGDVLFSCNSLTHFP